MRRNQFQHDLVEKQMNFLDDFDANSFENVFVKWDCYLREESHQRVKALCEKILHGKPFDDLTSLDEIVNPELDDELRISQVILRIYNRNPAVFINLKLNTFITAISQQIYEVAQELFRIRNERDSDKEEIKRKKGDLA
jgi:hypothetical protein